jgi:hypothetical protein
MASCFKCAVIDKVVGDADPIGVCKRCNSLACVDHGTRLKKGAEFKCALCLTSNMLDAAGLVRHEVYGPPPADDRGGGTGVPTPVGPSGGGGSGGGAPAVVEFESSADFERAAPKIAKASESHRAEARDIVDPLVEKVRALRDDPDREREVARIVVTSDPATIAAVDEEAVEVSDELRAAEEEGLLKRDLLADTLGVAAWAIGAEVGEEISVADIEMIPDRRLQFLLRAWSHYFTGAIA